MVDLPASMTPSTTPQVPVGSRNRDAVINVQGAAVDLGRLTNRQDLEQIALKYQISIEGLTRTAIIRKIMKANNHSNVNDPEPSKVIADVGELMRRQIRDVSKGMQLPVSDGKESAFALAKLIMEKTKNNGFGFTPTAHVTAKQAGAVDRRSVVQTAVQLGIPTEGRNRQEIMTDILTVTLATKAQPLNAPFGSNISNALQPSGSAYRAAPRQRMYFGTPSLSLLPTYSPRALGFRG